MPCVLLVHRPMSSSKTSGRGSTNEPVGKLPAPCGAGEGLLTGTASRSSGVAARPLPVTGRPAFTVEYLEPDGGELEADPLPDEFSASRMRRSLLVLGATVVLVAAAIVLVPGLASLRERFMGAQPGWLAIAAILQLASCGSYVLVFRAVFCRRMSWRTSSEIGLSELAANSVFSFGGAGGLALGAWILRRGGLAGEFIARRTVAFFLLTSLANVTFLALGGVGLATGALHGSPGLLLGIVPAAGATAAIAIAVTARPVAALLERRWSRARPVAAARAVGDGVAEALAVLRSGDP